MNSVIITSAIYLGGFKINIEFSDNTSRTIDFEPFLKENQHPQWDKYNNPVHFKKFKIKHGNLVWGRNWDLIFPVSSLYTGNIIEYSCSSQGNVQA